MQCAACPARYWADELPETGICGAHGQTIFVATLKTAFDKGTEIKARRTVAEAVHANEEQLDQTEIIKLLEEEMLQAAKNLEFERAAQLRDKLKEFQGAPTIKSGAGWAPDQEEVERNRIWQPKGKGRGKRAAK